MRQSLIGLRGDLTVYAKVQHPDRVHIAGAEVERHGDLFVIRRKNALVNTGLNITLDRLFGLGAPPPAIGWIGIDNDNGAVTAATVYLHGAAGATAATQLIKALSPAASRAAQTVTAQATFANADFTSGVFVIRKMGLLNTATDAGTGLIDVIGGAGVAPYNQGFTIDFTSAGSFTLTPQVQITASAT